METTTFVASNQALVLGDILAERDRHTEDAEEFPKGDLSSYMMDPLLKLGVLVEDLGSVATAELDRANAGLDDPEAEDRADNLRGTLITLASHAVAWAEAVTRA